MIHIIVDDDQAKLIAECVENIAILDRSGRHLGFVAHDFSDEDIAIAKQRQNSSERRYTTQEVMDYLNSLDQK
jgi:hypothetical protein